MNEYQNSSSEEIALTNRSMLSKGHNIPVETQSFHKSFGFINITTYIIIVSFISGLYSLCSLAFIIYQKDTLKLSPQTVQFYTGIIIMPWSVKPLFGYVIDKILVRVKKVKYILAISSISRLVVFLTLTYANLSLPYLYALLSINQISAVVESILAEYSLVLKTKEHNKKDNKEQNNQLPIYFGFRSVGALIGNFLGGRIIQSFSPQMTFFICIFFPFITLFCTICYKEKYVEKEVSYKNILEDIRGLFSVFKFSRVAPLLVLVCLLIATPDFGTLTTFYITDHLGFSTTDLANFASFGTICSIVGQYLYYHYLVKINPRLFFLTTCLIFWIINNSFLLVVFEIAQNLGVSAKIVIMLIQGATVFLLEMVFMPIITVWISIMPKQLEATSITLITGLINFSANFSAYFGAYLMVLLGIEDKNYNELWKLLVIQSVYYFIILLFLFRTSFPTVQNDKRENDEEIKTLSTFEIEELSNKIN